MGVDLLQEVGIYTKGRGNYHTLTSNIKQQYTLYMDSILLKYRKYT